MPRLCSIDDLKELRSLFLADLDRSLPRLVMCAGTACRASGANNIIGAVQGYIIRKGLSDRISLLTTGCHGFCEMGPFILAEPQRAFYTQVNIDDVPKIVDAVLSNRYLDELLYRDPHTGEPFYRLDDIPFFKNQRRTKTFSYIHPRPGVIEFPHRRNGFLSG